MDINDDKDIDNNLSILELFLFALTVSIDSFSIGVALGFQEENIILAGSIFSLCSFLFTFTGLILGNKIKEKLNNKINIIGAIILLVISIKYLIFSL